VRSLLQAISFLTILPVGKRLDQEPSESLADSMTWFPVVGLIPGGLMLAITCLSPRVLPPSVAAFLALLAAVVITGGLHLDGLSDWSDGLAGKSSEDVLRIMKDTRIGAFGVTAIALLLIGKYSAILALVSARHDLAVLVLAPVLARWTLTFLAATSDYPRTQGGTAKEFVGKGGWRVIIKAAALMAIVVLFASPLWGTIYIALATTTALLFRHHSIKRVGGITGDMLGAECEMVELVILMASLIISG